MSSPEPEPQPASAAPNAMRGGAWDQTIVTQLQIMGFSNSGAIRSALACPNSAEGATEWALAHSGDPDFNSPVPPAAATPTAPPTAAALFSFGVVADVQYADLDNGSNFLKTVTRYYRHSLDALRTAVRCWGDANVLFVAQLGDLLDGQNGNVPGRTASAEVTVMGVLAALPPSIPVYSCVGNHELYNWQRGGALEGSSIGFAHPQAQQQAAAVGTGARSTYYSFIPHAGWRFVVLDAFVISTMGYSRDHPNCVAAWALLDAHNPNDCRQQGVDLSQGMTGIDSRWMPYNGAHGTEQLAWLQRELQAAAQRSEKVVVLSHAGVAPGVCGNPSSCPLALALQPPPALRMLACWPPA